MGAVWSALLVGGGLAGALLIWLLRDKGRKGDAEKEEDAALGGDRSGGSGLSPGPSRREPITKPELLQESNGCLVSETKGPGSGQEAAWRRQSSPGEHAPFGWLPDTQSLSASATGGYVEASGNESRESRTGEWGFQKGQELPANAAPCFAETLLSSSLLVDSGEDGAGLAQLDRQDSEDWEMVSRHSSWGDIGLGGSVEAPTLSPSQGSNSGRNPLAEASGQEVVVKTRRPVVMTSEPPQVSVRFQVHYITSTRVQFVAVTGDHERLGRWISYLPLQYSSGGLWSRSVALPAQTVVQWKFVVVENGEITRWEECSNRRLEIGREDALVHKCWGIH
ncbi:starch-binding domain-containing protein 1 [Pipistrellus kuhlii]|uniref:Starch-binding domain-containing protein 1 n=1 Tax=Pipistrellus kuhlii TaxID=59472 RepID=A0A7J8B4Y7_PIPKU|nr:starch-binding domain-containing protein 1 [Pipistrellus kuhlii]KAF6393903.1 starch binding domain 1 [Pipistrellus kuhlii]